MKRVYVFDADGLFVGPYKAQESPLAPGEFIVPINSTTVAPPSVGAKQYAKWDGSQWSVEDVVEPPPPTPEELALAAKAAQEKQDAQAAKADAKFQSFIAMTPAEAKQWAKDSFPSLTLPEQKDFGALAAAVAILGRRL